MLRKNPLSRADNVLATYRTTAIFCVLFASFAGGYSEIVRGEETLPVSAAPRSVAAANVALPPDAPGRVLIFRGVLSVFSLGLDDLTGELQRKGYDARIVPPSLGFLPAAHLRDTYRADPQRRPLILIGHSKGGRMCLTVAKWLQKENIPVELVVVLDSNLNPKVPANVKRCVNLYATNPLGIFHGTPLIPEDPRTPVLNINLARVKRPEWAWAIDHFNIDDSAWMRQVVVNEVNTTCQRARTVAVLQRNAIASPPSARGKLLAPVVTAKQPVQNPTTQPRLMAPVFAPSAPPSSGANFASSPPSFSTPKPVTMQVSYRVPASPPPMRFDQDLLQSFRNVQAPATNPFRWPE